VTLGDTRSSPHPSMVTLGCLDERDEGGDRVATTPPVDNSVPTKGKCYSQESKKGTNNGTYRVKQVRAKCASNGAGVPLYGTQY
jgi:hypothetical protein